MQNFALGEGGIVLKVWQNQYSTAGPGWKHDTGSPGRYAPDYSNTGGKC